MSYKRLFPEKINFNKAENYIDKYVNIFPDYLFFVKLLYGL